MKDKQISGPLRRVVVVKHLGPGPHPSGSDQDVHAGGGGGSGRIDVPKFKHRREAVSFIRKHFLHSRFSSKRVEGSLGSYMFMELERKLDGSMRPWTMTTEDYQEIAETFAMIDERFPNMTVENTAGDEPFPIVWIFSDEQGSSYSRNTGDLIINTETRTVFSEGHLERVTRRMEGITEYTPGYERESILERVELLKTPEGRKNAHSAYWETNESNQFKMLMFHEFGHYIHGTDNRFDDLFRSPRSAYHPTARARDSTRESVAENFALWMIGSDIVHPDIAEVFDDISRKNGG